MYLAERQLLRHETIDELNDDILNSDKHDRHIQERVKSYVVRSKEFFGKPFYGGVKGCGNGDVAKMMSYDNEERCDDGAEK